VTSAGSHHRLMESHLGSCTLERGSAPFAGAHTPEPTPSLTWLLSGSLCTQSSFTRSSITGTGVPPRAGVIRLREYRYLQQYTEL
jgi:hypothetical protein